MTLGVKIKQYRIENKITQKALAALMGVSRTNIAEIESGRIKGTLKFINKLSEITEKPLTFWTDDKTDIKYTQYEALDVLLDAMISTGAIDNSGKIINTKDKDLIIAVLEKEIKVKLENERK